MAPPMNARLIASAIAFSRAGLTDGRITVLDQLGLGARTCECYAVVNKAFERLLPYATHP